MADDPNAPRETVADAIHEAAAKLKVELANAFTLPPHVVEAFHGWIDRVEGVLGIADKHIAAQQEDVAEEAGDAGRVGDLPTADDGDAVIVEQPAMPEQVDNNQPTDQSADQQGSAG